MIYNKWIITLRNVYSFTENDRMAYFGMLMRIICSTGIFTMVLESYPQSGSLGYRLKVRVLYTDGLGGR